MPRIIYQRKVALKGYNTALSWIKSGTDSKVFGLPYEIWEKRYSPDPLTVGPVNRNIVLDFASELRNIVLRRHLHSDHLIQAKATAIIGKNVDTLTRARRQYREDGKMATEHTLRYTIGGLNSLLRNLERQLDTLAQLPSKPSWLMAIDVTIYFNEGETNLIRQSGEAKILP